MFHDHRTVYRYRLPLTATTTTAVFVPAARRRLAATFSTFMLPRSSLVCRLRCIPDLLPYFTWVSPVELLHRWQLLHHNTRSASSLRKLCGALHYTGLCCVQHGVLPGGRTLFDSVVLVARLCSHCVKYRRLSTLSTPTLPTLSLLLLFSPISTCLSFMNQGWFYG